jgi:acyl-CoA thioesterase FadM
VNLWLRLLLLRVLGRYRPRLDLLDECVTPFRVLPGDLDLLRHMNNGRYLTILDIARLDLFARSGMDHVLARNGWYPVVTAETIAFHRALTLGRPFSVTTRTLGWDDRCVVLEQVFRTGRDGTGPIAAEAVIRALLLRRGGGRVPVTELLEAAGHPGGLDRPLEGWVADWFRAQNALWATRRAQSQFPSTVPSGEDV